MKKKVLMVFLAFIMVMVTSVGALANTHESAGADIVDTAIAAGDFTTLVTAVQEAGLVDALKGEGPFTVFAPTDQAFADLLEELAVTAEELLAREDLADILLYHVISGKVLSSDLVDGMEVETLNGESIVISLDPVKVNSANVITADLETTNGVIHVIDTVLVPEAEADPSAESDELLDIVDTAISADFTTLVAAVQAAGLVDALKGEGPFTVFAPTDEAFANLLAELAVTAEELLAREDLANILLYHVVSGKVLSTDLVDGLEVETLSGEKILISLNPVKINDSGVIAADIEASNGVIHVIDQVLIPLGEEEAPEIPKTGDNAILISALLAIFAATASVYFMRKSKVAKG
ncbi:fasciclin domain-containing protein [Anaerobacillus sp. CMMVII]|uniref:fasciclin domain-containing protein n=1 Tax=Anaerobacillus sp. CMMVII TaxID=2755588 RepID=UPI0021B7C705|nr:fasciclin domain-containing protein [Anaerobacillus sp. CMMVII]MCT8137900.1 fasciclin domain-containing protein [Anaerobacillus sp. CMMVII]